MGSVTARYALALASATAAFGAYPISAQDHGGGNAAATSEAGDTAGEKVVADGSKDTMDETSLEDGGRLDLVCGGSGSANKLTVTQGYGNSTITSQYGQAYGSSDATIYGTRSQAFGDQVSLFIEGGEGRIRMPRAMLPAVRGGEDGWFKLGNIEIKDTEITGTVRVNFMNKPQLRVDRFTGAISISGKAGDYAGQCQKVVPEETKKRF